MYCIPKLLQKKWILKLSMNYKIPNFLAGGEIFYKSLLVSDEDSSDFQYCEIRQKYSIIWKFLNYRDSRDPDRPSSCMALSMIKRWLSIPYLKHWSRKV